MVEFNNFDSIRIGLASPEKILSWSHGEVTKAETINYRSFKPEKEGLFCEKIFGPTKDWECHCGKYKKVKFKGLKCEVCGVEITKARVRRERMGHIKLAAPVSHIWYFRGIPSKMAIILDISPKALDKVLYFSSYIVTSTNSPEVEYKQLLNETEYRTLKEEGVDFEAGMGAEAVKKLLMDIDLDQLIEELNAEIVDAGAQKKQKLVRRLESAEAFKKSGNRPEWMILDYLPVIPPDLRPLVQLDGGRFATADLNDLYRRVINRNNRLIKLMKLNAPEIIIRNEKRILQEAVDALIDNGRRGRTVTGASNRPLKSLSDLLKGKTGRFRQNLLGKRVDYSGRSVIVVGPELKFYQCGLPKKMALELFKPFVMRRLISDPIYNCQNIKTAKKMVERENPEVWGIVEDIIQEHPVLLNRAPTLHRLGIQAFEPVLVEGKAIRLHPLVCTAFNADFDGDQMPVHIPLSVEAQAEARFLMLSVNNILAPKDGRPITTPSQDIVLGIYYLTYADPNLSECKKYYKDYNEMLVAHYMGSVDLHEMVGVRMTAPDGEKKIVKSTVGRFIFNECIPQTLDYVDREKDKFSLEIDYQVKKKDLQEIIARCYQEYGNTRTVILLDALKDMGIKYATESGITISVSDMVVPDAKKDIVKASQDKVGELQALYRKGYMTDDERYKGVIQIWTKAANDVSDALMNNLKETNSIKVMADSGARGSKKQIMQLAGMRGLMRNAVGRTVEIPITSNFREGMSVLEYFISATGARKGVTDTALRTADSGYLTRRLVDVSQEVIVREEDCGTTEGTEVMEFREGIDLIESFRERMMTRFPVEDVYTKDGKTLLCSKDQYITGKIADKIIAAGYTKLKVRSVLTCNTPYGVCAKCYGVNLATGKKVQVGETVGIIAAQSIGEPGTQLTMRTFHDGGVVGRDITQGLPRVEELFEARKPKGLAVIAEQDGIVSFEESKRKREIVITDEETGEKSSAQIVFGSKLLVEEGDKVEKGQPLTEGSINPQDLFRVVGPKGVINYITREIQKTYRLQGEDINDKHIEIIIKQMLSKIKVDDGGETPLLSGTMMSIKEFEKVNREAEAEGKIPATGTPVLLGITKASLSTDSFLSAASFQETTRVLTDAAVNGRIDRLQGLKENVIIGKLIPAGTGMKQYRNLEIDVADGLSEAEKAVIAANEAREGGDN